jgi:DNA-binding ferritin-like protein (Dps family)
MFNMKKQRQVFLTGEYLELYKELSHLLSYDLPNKEQREMALSGVEDLLIEAQAESRKPETIFGESKDTFYQDLIAAFPNNVGFYELKKTEHKRQHTLYVITILFVTSVTYSMESFHYLFLDSDGMKKVMTTTNTLLKLKPAEVSTLI